MKYFSISELCASDVARARRIDNTPSKEVEDRLTELATKVLDNIREQWGSGIRITSGYRCPQLNRAVGGSPTSAHVYGYAADTVPANGDMAAYQKAVLQWAKTGLFDQIIIEYPNAKGMAKWIHIAVRNGSGQQRRQILTTDNGRVYRTVAAGSRFYKV